MRRLFSVALLAVLPLLAWPAYAQGRDTAPVTMAWSDVYPWFYRDQDGGLTGYSVELAKMIADEIGAEIAPFEVGSIPDWAKAQVTGTSQILPAVGKLPHLVDTNVFSDPVITTNVRLAVAIEDLGTVDPTNLDGVRVGVLVPGSGSSPDLLPGATLVSYPNVRSALLGLLSDEVQALSVETTMIYAGARRTRLDSRIEFVGEPLEIIERYVAVHQSRQDLLPAINEALDRMRVDGRLTALATRFPVALPPAAPEVLTVGYRVFPPYKLNGPDGEPTGYSVEILKHLAERANLQITFKEINQAEWDRGPLAGDFDMLTLSSMEPSRHDRMDFTLPILEAPVSIFVRAGEGDGISGLDDLTGGRVGVLAGNIAEQLVTAHGGLDAVTFLEKDALLDALLTGQIKAVVFPTDTFQSVARASGVTEDIAEIAPPVFVTRAAPALRFGLGSVRERLNAVIPGFFVSPEYAELQEKYFSEPVYWTSTRIWAVVWGGVALLAGMVIFGALARWRNLAQARRESEAQAARMALIKDELETIFNAASSGIVALDKSGAVVRINNRARHMLGGISTLPPFDWPEGVHFLDSETLAPLEACADPIRRALSGNRLLSETHLMRRTQAGDHHRYVRVDSVQPESAQTGIHVVLVIDDVSNEERNRQVVERKSRLDALGQLTGGIAHDFNNLLASQLYAVDLARQAKDDEKRQNYLKIAEGSVMRGQSLTARLLAFARRQPGLASSRSVRAALVDFKALVGPMIEAQFEIVVDSPGDDLHVYCDQAQLETALMNLVLNARDAMLRSGKGNRIEIKARPLDITEADDTRLKSGGGAARCVEIHVMDNGPGMDPETLERCTDPFFTTKDTNSGTGLGLAMVYGFTRQSDGDFRVYSELGVGTSVQLTLPRGTQAGPRDNDVPEVSIDRGHGEIILLAEDERHLLEMTSDVLVELGYQVIPAKSGQEALLVLQTRSDVALLLTDVVMPGAFGGFELAKRAREIFPNLPVLYTSGYTGFTATEMGAVQAPLLQKPAPPAELSEAITAALAGAQRAKD